MVFPVVGGDGKPTGYDIDNSVRLSGGAELTFTPGQDGTKTTWTISCWAKKCENAGERQVIFGAQGGSDYLRWTDDESLNFHIADASATRNYNSVPKFKDPSAWYHIVAIWNTTDGTNANRMQLYVNGVLVTPDSQPTISQNAVSTHMNDSSQVHHIGGEVNPANDFHFEGHLAEFYFIDGTAKEPTDFGETNDNGVWIPKKYDGSYGTNGFFLEFQQTGTSANSSGIGADTSGNDHHFAVANLASTDITTDTPTNNFATLIPALNTALSEGNTKVVTTRQSNWDGVHSSIGVTSGKWYFEVKASLSDDSFRIGAGVAGDPETFPKIFNGLGDNGDPMNTFSNTYPFYGKGVWLDHWYDQNYDDSSTASTQSSGDILQFALDMDNYKLWVGVNGQFKDNSNNNVSYSDVASGNSPTVTIASAAYTGKTFFPGILIRDDQDADDNVAEINFGNPSFSISSGNTDGLYGNFEYAVPSGYYALCTKRLAEYG